MNPDAMLKAKSAMDEAARATLAADPRAPELAEQALEQLRRAQAEQQAPADNTSGAAP